MLSKHLSCNELHVDPIVERANRMGDIGQMDGIPWDKDDSIHQYVPHSAV